MKKADYVVVAAMLVVCAIGFLARCLSGRAASKADIYVDGKLYRTVVLSEMEQTVEIVTPYGSNTLSASKDGIKMTAADCPSQTCVHTPKQTASGGVIACLPHRTLIKLADMPEGEVDAIAD
jgi:hypothetical protein